MTELCFNDDWKEFVSKHILSQHKQKKDKATTKGIYFKGQIHPKVLINYCNYYAPVTDYKFARSDMSRIQLPIKVSH